MTEKTTTQFKELERGEIVIDEVTVAQNFRKEFNETQLKELADNIAKVGVLEPIILRKNRAYKVLVAGERRLRAAKLAGLQTIPYRLLDLTEQEALEVTALENLHRANLNPMEEAQAFQTLLQKGRYTVQDVAERIDKSKDYVYRTLRLLDLPEVAQKALITGEISAGHARQLLRVPPQQAEKYLKDIKNRDMSIFELRQNIDWAIGRYLEEGGFPLTEEYAGCQACSKCPYNTANQQSLFDEAVESGRCTNATCYTKKKDLAHEEFIASVKAKAEKTGMEFLEPKQTWGQNYDDFEKVTDELKEHFANEIKKHPEKFALSVDLYDDTEYMYITDKKLIEKAYKFYDEQNEAEEEEGGSPASQWEHDQAIRRKEDELISKRLAHLLPGVKISEEDFTETIGDFNEWQRNLIKETFEIEDVTIAGLSKLPTEKALVLVCLLLKLSPWNFSEEIGSLVGAELTEKELDEIHEQAVAAVDNEGK